MSYGKGQVTGHAATDRGCFDQSGKHCLNKMSFIVVNKSKDVSAIRGSGLIGLGPSRDKGDLSNLS